MNQVSQAESLAAGLPRLLLAAEKLAHAALPGAHGRRRAGPGETFWQFRDWRDGDDARRIDWRRSASGERLLLREREWEAQASVKINLQSTPGMDFRSSPNLPTKQERAVLLLLALSCLLLNAGERVALAGGHTANGRARGFAKIGIGLAARRRGAGGCESTLHPFR